MKSLRVLRVCKTDGAVSLLTPHPSSRILQIVDFVASVLLRFDFDGAQAKLAECESVIVTDFFLSYLTSALVCSGHFGCRSHPPCAFMFRVLQFTRATCWCFSVVLLPSCVAVLYSHCPRPSPLFFRSSWRPRVCSFSRRTAASTRKLISRECAGLVRSVAGSV